MLKLGGGSNSSGRVSMARVIPRAPLVPLLLIFLLFQLAGDSIPRNSAHQTLLNAQNHGRSAVLLLGFG